MARCISPLTIKQKGIRNIVPCGQCLCCLETKRAHWTFRIRQELKLAMTAKFLTFTYDDDHVPVSENGELVLEKNHMQLFMKKLRRYDKKMQSMPPRRPNLSPRSSKWPPLRYYTVGEYGTETDRPHFHSIMFNIQKDVMGTLPQIWGHGHVDIGTVTPASIHYVTKYVVNRIGDYTEKQKPFANISKGIGSNYLVNSDWHSVQDLRTYVVQDERKVTMPRYYKDKIFTDGQRRYLSFKSVLDGQLREAEEIRRIERLHPHPLAYLNEREYANYELISKRVNKKNLF